jgi:hypothetical protein
MQDRIQQSARNKGIPLQVAPKYSSSVMIPFLSNHDEVIGLFLPVKFSQTPSEVIDTKDLNSLSHLLYGLLHDGGL